MGYDATGGKPFKANQDGPIWYVVIGLVVALCFGAVLFGPKLLGGNKDYASQTIAELVAKRPVPEAAGMINAYGFQDELTKAVLLKVEQLEPVAHARLVTDMAEKAQAGADRNALSLMLLSWGGEYIISRTDDLFKTDVAFLDQALVLMNDVSKSQKLLGGRSCNLAGMYRVSQNPDLYSKYLFYQSQNYQFGMQGVLLALSAIESLQNGASDSGEYTAEDKLKLDPVVMQLAANPEIPNFFKLILGADLKLADDANVDGSISSISEDSFAGINGCEQLDSLIAALQSLPPGTRARFWAAGLKEAHQAAS